MANTVTPMNDRPKCCKSRVRFPFPRWGKRSFSCAALELSAVPPVVINWIKRFIIIMVNTLVHWLHSVVVVVVVVVVLVGRVVHFRNNVIVTCQCMVSSECSRALTMRNYVWSSDDESISTHLQLTHTVLWFQLSWQRTTLTAAFSASETNYFIIWSHVLR